MSEKTWDLKTEQERFKELWLQKPQNALHHTPESWNVRAEGWAKEITENGIRKKRSEQRVFETAEYLKARKVLTADTDIIDIGCGLGRFVAEFAKTARHAVGTDISPRMLELGEEYAKSQGLSNVSYVPCDFKAADIRAMGWEKAFDVVFSSITPAVASPESLDKTEAMSRKYCFSSNFVFSRFDLAQRAYNAAFPGEKWCGARDGQGFYALFNLLWLRGRFPEVRYYKEEDTEKLPVSQDLVTEMFRKIREDEFSGEARKKIYDFLLSEADEDGMVTFSSVVWYGWLLWRVDEQGPRDYGEI